MQSATQAAVSQSQPTDSARRRSLVLASFECRQKQPTQHRVAQSRSHSSAASLLSVRASRPLLQSLVSTYEGAAALAVALAARRQLASRDDEEGRTQRHVGRSCSHSNAASRDYEGAHTAT